MIFAIFGASGLGVETYGLAKWFEENENRWENIIFVDDAPEKDGTILIDERKVYSYPNAIKTFGKENLEFIVAIGEPKVKDMVYRRLKADGCKFTNLIHYELKEPDSATIGEGVIVHARSPIPSLSVIGNNVLIQSTSIMGHGVKIGDSSIISSFDFIGGDTEIGSQTYVAPHSCLRNGIKIGSGSIVGMGSIVTKDLPDDVVAYGSPCQVKRTNDKGRVFSK